MNAVLLDGYTINPGDLSWDKLSSLCDAFTVYDSSYNDDLVPRIGDREIVFTSKTQITRQVMEQCPNLKYIGLTATGYNNVYVAAAADLGIAVTNVPAYENRSLFWQAKASVSSATARSAAKSPSWQKPSA